MRRLVSSTEADDNPIIRPFVSVTSDECVRNPTTLRLLRTKRRVIVALVDALTPTCESARCDKRERGRTASLSSPPSQHEHGSQAVSYIYVVYTEM